MTWLWIVLGAYWIAIMIFAWELGRRYPEWPLIPSAVMAVCWPWFVGHRIVALWKASLH
jgi:hypothetical protein